MGGCCCCGGGGKEKSEEEKKENLKVLVAIQLFVVVNAIVGIIMASITHASFSAAVNDYKGVINNWETPPAVLMYYVENGTDCAPGDKRIGLPHWPGTNSSACACPEKAVNSTTDSQTSSGSWGCTSDQLNAGCWDQEDIGRVYLSWFGGDWCYSRDGSMAQYKASQDQLRPVPASSSCPTGYQTCGNGTSYDNGAAICFPSGEECPYTGMQGGSSPPSGKYHAKRAMNMSLGHKVFLVREGFNQLPFNEFRFSFFDGGKRGICYRPENARKVNQREYKGKGKSNRYNNKYNSKCSKASNVYIDTRYKALDTMRESDFLMQNFLEHDWCQSCTNCDDYIATGNICGTDPFSSPDCLQYDSTGSQDGALAASGGCTDDDCREIMYQSKCGALKRWANQSDNEVGIFGRREIYWDTTCEVSMDEMADIQARVRKVAAALLAVLVLSIIINVITGIIMPFVIVRNAQGYDWPCIPGEGEMERKLIKRYNQYIGFTLKAGKAIPSFIAIGVIEATRYYFRKAVEGKCSDRLTNKTFLVLSEMLPEARANLIGVLVIDCILLTVAILEVINEFRKSHSKKVRTAPEP